MTRAPIGSDESVEDVDLTPIRVVIVDDQELVRMGFRMILESEPGLEVVGEAADGLEAIDIVARTRPDVVAMDVQMPRLDGLEATRRITAATPESRILILTTFDRDDYLFDALSAGAAGFLLKNAPPESLIDGIRILARGDALLAPEVTRRVIERFAARATPAVPSGSDLTERERDVVGLVARGLSNLEIAEALHVGEATVKTHVSHALLKLGLRDRIQLVIWAYESGAVAAGEG